MKIESEIPHSELKIISKMNLSLGIMDIRKPIFLKKSDIKQIRSLLVNIIIRTIITGLGWAGLSDPAHVPFRLGSF